MSQGRNPAPTRKAAGSLRPATHVKKIVAALFRTRVRFPAAPQKKSAGEAAKVPRSVAIAVQAGSIPVARSSDVDAQRRSGTATSRGPVRPRATSPARSSGRIPAEVF